jgi:hypothetical protein
MAVGFPTKVSYIDGDVFSASDINDTNGTINLLGSSVAYAAGKNKIINGDFTINQRAFTSNTTSLAYNFDRFFQQNVGGSFTVTPQTFTPGAAPAAPYESSNFLRGITASQSAAGDYAIFTQKIEDVRTLAGQTATVSFWAKANTGTPKIGVELSQNFGSGGSPSTQVDTALGAVTLTTSWARYSVSVSVPSLTGKTIGTSVNSSSLQLNLWTSSGSSTATRSSSIGIQNFTADIWGVQVEQGSTATAFQTASGSIGGELALCQRYYYRAGAGGTSSQGVLINAGFSQGTTSGSGVVQFPVIMRIGPTALDSSLIAFRNSSGGANSMSSVVQFSASPSGSLIQGTISAVSANLPGYIMKDSNAAGYIGFSAEI